MPGLTLFGSRGAPNPRRVEIFLAEHGIHEGTGYAFVDVDMSKGEHKVGGKHATPNSKLPSLRITEPGQPPLDLAESVAICRYAEEQSCGGSQLKLFGRSPRQRAVIEMMLRRVEFEFLSGSVGKAWVNGPVLEGLRKARGLVGHESELQLGLAAAQSFLREMNGWLDPAFQEDEQTGGGGAHGPPSSSSSSSEYVGKGGLFLAGDEFSIADITLLCVLDFAAGPVFVPLRWPELPFIESWHRRVSARPSVAKHCPNPHLPKKANGVQRYDEYKDNGVWRPRIKGKQ
jgi:glutathione S-transferase